MSFPFLIQGDNITIVIDNVPHTVNRTHVTFDKVRDAVRAGDWELVRDIIEPKKAVINYGRGNVSIHNDEVFWRGLLMNGALAERMLDMLREGFPVDPLVNFMDNLMANPSNRAVTELYGFLEKCNLPITEDGCFLAYKKVRDDYLDCHSATIDNSVGQVVSMPRNQVNDNCNETCSSGLHFCSQEYLNHFRGSRVMILKINPADVVSIPTDYDDSKGRCCRYEVIGELGVRPEDAFVEPVQSNAYGSFSSVPEYDTTPNNPQFGQY